MPAWARVGLFVLVAICERSPLHAQDPQAPPSQASEILELTGVSGGFVAQLGVGDAQLLEALAQQERLLVHGLDRNPAAVQRARDYLREQGVYGEVSVDRLKGNRLPYVSNMVNLFIAQELDGVSLEEVERVLAPQGVAFVRHGGDWKLTVKPRPAEIDEWTHYLHDASGNAVAHDERVGPPRHLQWLSGPRWSRHHDRMASMSAMVSASGRIFYVMDEGSRISIQMPPRWRLVARDAFNGTPLWKREIKSWQNHLWPLKSGPTQLARRLVAEGDRVFVTLGIDEPVTAIEAATGDLQQTYSGTEGTEEILLDDGVLVLLINDQAGELAEFGPQLNLGDQRRVRETYQWNRLPRRIAAVDVATEEVLWSAESIVAPLSLATSDGRVFFHDGERVRCLDRTTGELLWKTIPIGRRPDARMTMNFGPRLLVYGDIVLFAGGDRSMRAIDTADGNIMWTAPHARGGYESPEDLLVSGGLVWSAPTTSTRDSGVFSGRDVKTGEVKVEFPPDVETYWFHHRCYIAKATDKYLLPSRTGIEFVDFERQKWEIHHWVRGGCLYGIMPCNGLVYAPPHNCACYPEAKLYGMNALAPASADREVEEVIEAGRLETGPAFNQELPPHAGAPEADWPTFRHDASRSGSTTAPLSDCLEPSWKVELGGKLTSVVIADGLLYVAQIDRHTLHALNSENGDSVWSFTAGGRIDSPPTVAKGRVHFGSADGWMYCLRADTGVLIWRFRAAPRDERLVAFDQLESVWPVHGTPLVENDTVYFVAGRSNFLDGGVRFLALDAATGNKFAENVFDDKDPETGENIQARLQVLNMPAGLPDILSSDGRYLYMRSQRLDQTGFRRDLGPHSGNPAEQGSVQSGETAHLFAPMGYLDDTYFHRAYWVFGRSFAGGHGGYYQAGKYAPSGRILVADNERVYGFGRKPQYLKWTTTIEHQLFASSKTPPPQARESLDDGRPDPNRATRVEVPRSSRLNPKRKPLAVAAWVYVERPTGVVLAHGGPSHGYALAVRQGKPQFSLRSGGKLVKVDGTQDIVAKWVHLCGVLTGDKQLKLFVNGKLAGQAAVEGLLTANPQQGFEIGADHGGSVGDYRSPSGFTGLIDEVRLWHGEVSDQEVADLVREDGGESGVEQAKLILAYSFDDGTARDGSVSGLDGTVDGGKTAAGKVNRALRFTFNQSRGGGTFVRHLWTQDIPLVARAMLKAGDKLFVAGPPDLIDEEKAFGRLVRRAPGIAQQLAEQDAAYEGALGGRLRVVSAADGRRLADYELESLPVWDGLATAAGRLFFSTTDGHVVCRVSCELEKVESRE